MTTFAGTATLSRAPRWWVLVTGIASLLLGILLLTQTAATLTMVVTFIGAYWLVSGIATLLHLLVDRADWGWKLLGGAIGVLAGLTVLGQPLLSTILLPSVYAIVIGIQGLVFGLVLLLAAFRGAGMGVGVAGGLSIVLSLVVLFNPLMSAAALVLVTAWMAIIGGVLTVVSAFARR